MNGGFKDCDGLKDIDISLIKASGAGLHKAFYNKDTSFTVDASLCGQLDNYQLSIDATDELFNSTIKICYLIVLSKWAIYYFYPNEIFISDIKICYLFVLSKWSIY